MADRDREDAVLRSEAAFEKWLLDAAGSDGPPPGAAEAAWARFDEAAGGALPNESQQSGPAPRRGAPSGALAAPSGASAAKWLGIGAAGGAILGGLLTAFVLRGGMESEPARVEGLGASSAEAPAAGGSGARAPEAVVPAPPALPPASGDDNDRDDDGGSQHRGSKDEPLPSAAGAKLQAPPRAGWRARAPRNGERRARVLSTPKAPGDAAAASPHVSSLDREVALLDAIRMANARKNFSRGLELVARYRDEFEGGELARDADVFEIEALAGAGERARSAEAARAFLSRYPGDPHTRRVRALAAAGSP